MVNRVPTGIASFDSLIDGGFPKPSCIAIIGETGSGKSIFCLQTLGNLLERGFNAVIYTVDYSVDDLREQMSSFGWDLEKYEKKQKIKCYDAFAKGMQAISPRATNQEHEGMVDEPDDVAKISYNFREMISFGRKFYFDAMVGKGDLVVIFDSFTPIFQAAEFNKVIKFLQSMRYASRVGRAIGLATLQMNLHPIEVENSFLHLADGVVEMRRRNERGAVIRTLRIVKMAKTAHYEEYCPLDITDRGILVHKMPATSSTF